MTEVSAAELDSASLWRILDVTRQLSLPTDLDTMLSEVIVAARQVLHADRGTVFLHDAEKKELYSKVATGDAQIRVPMGKGIAGQCGSEKRLINVRDCYSDERFNQQVDRDTGYRSRCLLAVPLVDLRGELVGVLQLLNKIDGSFDDNDEHLAIVLAAQCAVALQRAQLIEDQLEKQKLDQDLAIARDIQQRVLPKAMPEVGGYDLSGWNKSADMTGGDIYDAVALDEKRVLLMLGDATGHGIGPALSVTQVRAMMRIAVRFGADLNTIVAQINDQLADDLAANRFVTAFLGVLDSSTHTVHYHAGGQGPLLYLHAADGNCDCLDASTIPLGIMRNINLEEPQPFEMQPGDVLALMTDGVFEYANSQGEQFGEERVMELLQEHRELPAKELLQTVLNCLEKFAGDAPQLDDITVILVKRLKN